MQPDTILSLPYHTRARRSESKFQLFALAKFIPSGKQENESLVIQEAARSNCILRNMYLIV